MKAFVQSLLQILRQADPSCLNRKDVVAHASLTAFKQHWPDHPWLAELAISQVLEATNWIREAEAGRWIKQRRLALSRLARDLRE